MVMDIALGIVFFGSICMLWYRMSEKIPQVIAIPDEVITQRLHEHSARFRIFLLHAKTFYKEEYYRNLFWNFLGKILYRLHIFVLRMDNGLIRLLKKVRAHNGFSGLFIGEQEMHGQAAIETHIRTKRNPDAYWTALKDEIAAATNRTVRKRHVEGVRVRTRKTYPQTESLKKEN